MTKRTPPAAATTGEAAGKRHRATSREVALDTLYSVSRDKAFSNLQLNKALQTADLSRADAGLATELVYGTLQRRNTLDYWLAQFVSKGLQRLEPWVVELLRMSVYQIVYLDRIPPHAAVNEAVQIAKRRGHAGIAGMVNGVLRNMLRRRDELIVPDESDPAQRIALQHSHPLWLVKLWLKELGEAETEAVCAAGNVPPSSSLRINLRRLNRDEAVARLSEEGCEAVASALAPAGVIVTSGGNLADTIGFRDGFWTVQDESSMLVAEAADPQPGMRVLDCCAAPGGKTAHLAEKMNNEGTVWANDLHPHKQKLIAAQAERLGLTCIKTMSGDAAQLKEHLTVDSMDVVLLDAPCSGLGVIRRKPEIKWTKSLQDIDSVAQVQQRLLASAAQLVKPGGTLVYSTCTIARSENELQIEQFLKEHPDYSLDPNWPAPLLDNLRLAGAIPPDFAGMVQLLPNLAGNDGFFIARLRRQAE
ncbi:16S rRNA (cytosine(967)-C(5))-methyltransferase RsmB [Paenibacillaceae bacterium]|nr:16S rRNA (cytosine(967)-C(5))-methyltransferase RsmB [Paenibacillaceae bacterium]